MRDRSPANGSILLAALLGVVIGAIGGYYGRFWVEKDSAPSLPPGTRTSVSAGSPSQAPVMPAMGGAMGVASAAEPGFALARTVRSLATIQRVQGKGLARDQAKALLPLLKKFRQADRLPASETGASLDTIMKALSEEQRNALASMNPFRRASGTAGRTSAPSGPPARPVIAGLASPGGAGAGGPGMGLPMDPERPFADERNRAALDELIGMLEKLAK